MIINDDDFDPDYVSKSQRKRDMDELQSLGKRLTELTPAALKKLPLPEEVLTALLEAQRFKNEALRRQLQYIGKLMRSVEIEPLREAIKVIEGNHTAANAHFHSLERWRDRLIKEGDKALGDFLTKYPQTDTQHIRQLIQHAQHEMHDSSSGAARKLFRYIRDVDEAGIAE
jgi:ribosome-associated protein